jgi:hypothetical protein
VIIWLNGTFGAGKTTTSAELANRLGARVFDAEYVGYLLRIPFPEPVGDFQDLALWRPLVVETAARIHEHTGGPLVIPQKLLVEAYAREIFDGLAARGYGASTTSTPTPRPCTWLRRVGTIVDTDARKPAAVAQEIAAAV